jgi:tripartite-type tricarboxylate transporter receptor subunit TctC
MFLRNLVRAFPFSMLTMACSQVAGQDYPSRPIRVVTSATASAADFVARIMAQGLAAELGQQVIVDNRSSSLVPGQNVAQAQPDGHTLLVHGPTFWIGALMRSTPYDTERDFAPITLATSSPNILVVHPAVAVRTVKDLIALAKSKPGEFNYGSAGSGSSSHLAGELFNAMAGVKIVRVPYANNALRMADILSGQVQVMFPSPAPMMPHIRSGRLRALAVTSPQPSVLVPDLPTVAASGLPGYESVSMFGMFAPARTPAAVLSLLNRLSVQVLNRPEVREKFFNAGAEVIASSPAQFAATVKAERERLGKVIRDAGIREE